jgi:DNA-binding transcriptional ArsR family regulator
MAQIVVLKRAHFSSFDHDIIDVHGPTIGAIGVGIYTALVRFANRKTGECWPSIGRLAQVLDLARSTVKVYLRKLEDAGLIDIRERQDAAGDPTSNLYTLLDPSPAAVAKRLAARKAATAPEGGRPPADPPPAECRPTGRPPADPEPDPAPLTTEKNHAEDAHAAEETPKTRTSNPCPHPLEELSHYDDVTICRHCWTMIDGRAHTTLGGSEPGEKPHAHATCAA